MVNSIPDSFVTVYFLGITERGGELLGDEATSLDSERNLTETTGQTGTQKYRETFREHQKAVEAVLDTEPLPFEQRQVIQRYFESIRSTGNE